MPVYPSVRDHGVELCERAGYDVTANDDPGTPAAVADPAAATPRSRCRWSPNTSSRQTPT